MTKITCLARKSCPLILSRIRCSVLFAEHGTVESAKLVIDRDTGRPRGFGFVEMSNADASRAMQALNGKEFEGRALKVNEAQESNRSGGGNRSGGNRGGPRRY